MDALSDLLHSLPALIDEAREAGLPVVLERASPLPAHAQRLMDTLGVEVRIVTATRTSGDRALQGARTEGHYSPTYGPRESNGVSRADWIDYRASSTRVWKRRDAGETPALCDGCETEIDVDDVVHSPRCPVFLGTQPKARAADWDQNAAITALRAWSETHDGHPPTSEDWRRPQPGFPTYAIVVQLFGSWNDGIVAAGLEPHRDTRATPPPSATTNRRPHGYWTQETYLAAIQDWALAHDGAPPTATEWFKPSGGRWPSVSKARQLGGRHPSTPTAVPEVELPEAPIGQDSRGAAVPTSAVPAREQPVTPPKRSDTEDAPLVETALQVIDGLRRLLDLAEAELRG